MRVRGNYKESQLGINDSTIIDPSGVLLICKAYVSGVPKIEPEFFLFASPYRSPP